MEFISQKFGASLGGCPDGIPAQKGGKGKQVRQSNDEQGQSGQRVSLVTEFGQRVDRDIGAKNVNLRPSEEAVDLKVSEFTLIFHRTLFTVLCSPLACLLLDCFFISSKNNKAGMSEVQRLESAMKDMLASFKQKVG